MRDAKADLAICEAATPGPWEYEWQYTYSNILERSSLYELEGITRRCS
mgnify:CR=1 FL=1|jgi:hypothetical protein